MKVIKTEIPENSGVNQYLPADYNDTFVCVLKRDSKVIPTELMTAFWTVQPRWVRALFRLRNILVRPFGLDSSKEKNENQFVEELKEAIILQANDECILCLDDKHLKAYLSVYCESAESGEQKLHVITLVHYHYWLGKAYFAIIRPFHAIVVRETLKYVLKRLS